MPHPQRHRHTFADYLAVEEVARVKHEYLDGEIFAMAGGTPEHAALAAAITTTLGEQLRGGPCRVYSSDLRVRILATGLATYPDVTVVCGPTERDPESATHVTNPRVVVEVLSDGTEDYDRGEKLEHYRQAPSIQTVILVSHRERRIELLSRTGDGWSQQACSGGETVEIDPVGCSLDVDELYDAASEQL